MSGRNPQGSRFEDPFAETPQEDPLPESGPAAERQRDAFADAVEERDPFVDELEPRRDVGIAVGRGPQLRESAQADIEQSAQEQAASENEFVNPSEINAEVGATGVRDVSLGISEQTVAARQFEAETPLDDVEADDVEPADDGFGLVPDAQRDLARERGADQLSERLDRDIEPGDLDVIGEDGDFEVRL